MDARQAVFFRGEFRHARAKALRDAEAYHDLIFALERLGGFLHGGQASLSKYQPLVADLASASPLASTIPAAWRSYHTPFDVLYTLVRRARNHAFHEGVFARHLTVHAIELSITLEQGLEAFLSRIVADYMVRDPVIAEPWHPVSFIRQRMLLNSFSYLPVQQIDTNDWALISDLAVAKYLRSGGSDGVSPSRLAKTLSAALGEGLIFLESAEVVEPTQPIEEALSSAAAKPVLVIESGHLVGLITPFDLL